MIRAKSKNSTPWEFLPRYGARKGLYNKATTGRGAPLAWNTDRASGAGPFDHLSDGHFVRRSSLLNQGVTKSIFSVLARKWAHFVAGLLTGARPAAFTVIPRRVGQGWELGSVRLTRVRWYNAAPSALAPFVVAVLPFMVAWWRTRAGLNFQWIDVALAFAVAPQFLACWPSTVDWKISLRSWPYLLIAGLLWWAIAAMR